MKFRIGDIVKLNKNSQFNCSIYSSYKTSSNPNYCNRVVYEIRDNSRYCNIQVKWLNSTSNGYNSDDLDLIRSNKIIFNYIV